MHYQPKQDLLNDRIITVTGASDGIGREAAMTYARYGATVILLGRNEEKLRQVASHINEETGRQPQWFILDLLTCTSEDCQQLAQRIAVNYPRLDGVLHNAGLLGDVCPMSEQNPQVWQDVIQVNVNATFMLTQHCFLYYSNRTPVHWSLLHQALDVRDEPTGAHMQRRNLPPKG